jgi:predicted RNase H-like HicB family nuclease
MKVETTKDAAHYLSLPYTIILRQDEEGDYVGRIQELSGCTAHGETEAVAVKNLREVQALWIDAALSAGIPIPEPEKEELPSGKWLQRVPRKLHRQLIKQAALENVSLNQLVTTMLTESVTARAYMRAFETVLIDAQKRAVKYSALAHILPAVLWMRPDTKLQASWHIPFRTEPGELVAGTTRARKLLSSAGFLNKVYTDEHEIVARQR